MQVRTRFLGRLKSSAVLMALPTFMFVGATLPSFAQQEEAAPQTIDATDNAGAAEQQPASAQSAPPRSLKLDEVVVTARKRAEDVQDVPFSITAISGETLRESNIQDITNLSAYLPNVTVGATPTFQAIYVRGLGSSFNDGFEPSVGLYVDGVYMGRQSYLNDSLIDVSRVELLRGPQGTLFGKNTVAGALSLTTTTPSYEWEAQGDVMYGSSSAKRFNGIVNIPVIDDKLAFRLAGQFHKADGYVDNQERFIDEVAIDKKTVKGKVRFQPISAMDIVMSVDYSKISDNGAGLEIVRAINQTRQFYSMFNSRFEGFPNRVTWTEGPGYAKRDTLAFNVNANWDVWNGHTITIVGGYTRFKEGSLFDADTGPVPLFNWDNIDDRFDQWSAEVRLTSGPGRLEYVAGLFAYANTFDAYTIFSVIPGDTFIEDIFTGGRLGALGDILALTFGPIPEGEIFATIASDKLFQTFNQDTLTLSAFAQVTYHAFDWLELVAGIRGHNETKDAFIKQEFEKTGVFLMTAFNVEEYETDQSRDETNVAPKFSVKAELFPDVMAYGTIAWGFKAGGFNPFAPTPAETTFEQEESFNYEVGVKSTLFDERLTFNVGYFNTTFDDLQVSVLTGIGTAFFVDNAASATSHGVEWEIRFVPWLGGMINYAGAWLDATYDNFEQGPCRHNQDGDDEGFCDMSGKRLARSPKWEMTASFNQMIPLWFWNMGVMAGFDVAYQSDHYVDVDLDPATLQKAYFMWNGRIGVADLDGAWALMLNGQNIFDRDVAGQIQDLPLQPGSFIGLLADGRRWNVEARFTF